MNTPNTIDLATVKPLARLGRNAIRHGLREGTGAILRAWGVQALYGRHSAEQIAVANVALSGYRCAARREKNPNVVIVESVNAAGDMIDVFEFAMSDYLRAA